MTDFARLLHCLTTGQVEFIVIGGFAATAHGSAYVTVDLDVVYRRTADNVRRLAYALAPLSPYLRGAPRGLPFSFDAATIERGLNFTQPAGDGRPAATARRVSTIPDRTESPPGGLARGRSTIAG